MAASKTTKRSITADYEAAFVGMRSYQKMRIGYIYGCVVVGFTCDGVREPGVYTPTFHLHNLAKPFPTVTLSAAHTFRPRGVSFSVSYQKHDETITQITDYFRSSCPLILPSRRSLDLLVSHHKSHLDFLRGTVLYPNILEHEIPIYARAYFGDIDGAMQHAENTVKLLAQFPDEQVYRFSGGTKLGWIDQLEADFKHIHDLVAGSVAGLRLTMLEHHKEEGEQAGNGDAEESV